MTAPEAPDPREGDDLEAHVRSVRLGHGANCSSIGSVVDTLFATAVLGTAVFAAIAAAMKSEEVRVVGGETRGPPPRNEDAKAPAGEDAP